MKIVVDNKIPYIRESLEKIADEVVYLPGNEFTPDTIRGADALIIRTRTRCNRELLEGSSVRFIATATIGYDHIDTDYCRHKGIAWTNAPGCNAASVAQYVHSALLLLKLRRGTDLQAACIGIIGVGHVGTQVAEIAKKLGMRVLLNDPPRQDKGEKGFDSLETLQKECDILTFHVPLYREGKYRTYHLADLAFFRSLGKQPVIINTSRGEVIETGALREAIRERGIREAIIDVWENEPAIDLSLLEEVFIGTPHIAGYSADGKANATRLSLEALCRFFGIRKEIFITPPAPPCPVIEAATEEEFFLQIYNPEEDCRRLREHPECFEQLRGNYPLRRESGAYLRK